VGFIPPRRPLANLQQMSAYDAMDGSSAGIAMCGMAVDLTAWRTSGYGT